MEENPTYEELQSANAQLMQRIQWLEGVYQSHRDEGLQIQSRFLSNISHEIRTPMNAILGFSDLLNNSALTESERNEYVQYISHNSRALLKVMDNIIDLSLIESNSLEMKQEDVFVADLFREIYDFYNSKSIRTMNYRVALLMTTPARCERVTVKADGYRLHRILDNLVNNAITSQQKGVVEMKMDVNDSSQVIFSIIRNRNALLEERAKKIFENNGYTDDWYNQIDSTGLAFKLARDLARAMGGSVSLEEVDENRVGINLELPVIDTGKVKKISPEGELSKMMN